MKYLISSILIFLFISCQKGEFPKGVPSCIKQRIRKLERSGDYAYAAILRYQSEKGEYFELPSKTQSSPFSYTLFNNRCEEVCLGDSINFGRDCFEFRTGTVDTIYIIQSP